MSRLMTELVSAIEGVLNQSETWEQCSAEKATGGGISVRCQFQEGHPQHSFDSEAMRWRERERDEARAEAAASRRRAEEAMVALQGKKP